MEGPGRGGLRQNWRSRKVEPGPVKDGSEFSPIISHWPNCSIWRRVTRRLVNLQCFRSSKGLGKKCCKRAWIDDYSLNYNIPSRVWVVDFFWLGSHCEWQGVKKYGNMADVITGWPLCRIGLGKAQRPKRIREEGRGHMWRGRAQFCGTFHIGYCYKALLLRA